MSATDRILIIDDEPYLRTTLALIMKSAGYQTDVAANAQEALQLLKSTAYHLILLDVNMPGISGMQLLPEIQRLYPDTPVVILTGYGTPEIADRAMQMGVRDYLLKPLEPTNLLYRIQDILVEEPG